MITCKQQPRRMRGGAIGDFLFWLVSAATAAGFVFVLFGKNPAPSPGTPEEIAERLEPIGQVVLAEPAGGAGALQVPAPVSAVSEVADAAEGGVEAQKAERAPVGEEEPSVVATEAAAIEPVAAARVASKPGPAEPIQTSLLPEPSPAPLTEPPAPAAANADKPATDSAVPMAAEMPAAPADTQVSESASGHEPGAAAATGAPGAGAMPSTARSGVAPQPVAPLLITPMPAWPQPLAMPGPPPLPPPGWRPRPAHEMIWVPRYDLPGSPLELRPMPRQKW